MCGVAAWFKEGVIYGSQSVWFEHHGLEGHLEEFHWIPVWFIRHVFYWTMKVLCSCQTGPVPSIITS